MRKRMSSGAVLILLLTGLLVSMMNLSANQTGKVVAQQAEPTIFEADVPVRGTFLRNYEWWPYWGPGEYEWDDDLEMYVGVSTQYHIEAPLIVNLQANGFAEGDKMMISYNGEIYYAGAWTPSDPGQGWPRAGPDNFTVIGVFSSTSELKSTNELNRVPGAIDAGKYTSQPWWGETWWDENMTTIIDHLKSKDVDVSNLQYGSAPTDIPQDFKISPHTGMWITVPNGARYLFICVPSLHSPSVTGSVTVTLSKDTDGDGLSDSWETNGIDVDKDRTIDLVLEDADWQHKDIYVEVDFMEGHMPDRGALNDVEDAFYQALVENPDDDLGINLHVEVNYEDSIPHQDVLYGWGDFLSIKNEHFGTPAQQADLNKVKIIEAKKMAYHYCLFAHQYALFNNTTARWEITTSGGLGECPGNDFFISLGAWTGGMGSRDEQAGTFMHELGHNLGLQHGGGDDVNYKPNYMSIMNYLFQLPITVKNRPLTFSSKKMPDLKESSLDETVGLAGANWAWSAYSWFDTGNLDPNYKFQPKVCQTALQIDWNYQDDYERNVQANINNFPLWNNSNGNSEVLHGFDDWKNLKLNFCETEGYSGSVIPSFADIEITWETVQAMREATMQRQDVAVTNLSSPTGTVGQAGFTVDVIVVNLGGNLETLNVTIYANTTIIASKTLTLLSCNITTINLPCTTTGLRVGNYTLTAYVKPLANETYIKDNTIISGVIKVVDNTPPTVTISSPTSGSEVQASTVTVTWTGSDVNSGVAGYEVRLDGGSWISVGTSTNREFTGLNDGSHLVEVRAADLEGNTKMATVNFTVNTSSWLLPAAAVGGVAAVIIVVVLFFWRSRAKKT